MAVVNDVSIPDTAVLLRVLRDNWTCVKNNRTRPQSLAFIDGITGEVSCFVDGAGVEAAVRKMFPGQQIAKTTASIVRQSGLAVARRPGECQGFEGDAQAHVVIGSATAITKKEYERCARKIAVHDDTTII
jgi:hypothetical protein